MLDVSSIYGYKPNYEGIVSLEGRRVKCSIGFPLLYA
jgi:hypothetical protein